MSEIGEKLINEVRMAAAADPDFVYEPDRHAGCTYVRDGKPSCLIGHGLWRLGLIDAALEDRKTVGAPNYNSVYGLLNHLKLKVDRNELLWLANVQKRQDSGEPWGHCVGIS